MDFHVVREGRKVKSWARFPNLVSGTGHSLQNYNNDFYEAVNIAVSQRMWSSVILKLDKDEDYQEFLDFERFSVYEEFKKYRLFNRHQQYKTFQNGLQVHPSGSSLISVTVYV